jgi:hypothetical protein
VTGGSFQYLRSDGGLIGAYQSLEYGFPSSYEAVLTLDGIGLVPAGVYNLGFDFTATHEGDSASLGFRADLEWADGDDNRVAIRLAHPCSSDADCLLDRVCNTETSQCEAGSNYPVCPTGETLTSNGCRRDR